MHLSRFRVASIMTLRSLVRRRIVLIMLFLIPTLFSAIIILTTSKLPIRFQLASLGEEFFVAVPQRHEGLIFICLVAVGLLSAFLALDLAQRDSAANRRLVLAGFRPGELIAARLGVLVAIILTISAFVVWIVPPFFRPERFWVLYLGLALGGWIYACYGLFVGSVFQRELEGVLFVVLLTAIDVGWLQNPIYYADAPNQAIIRSLPAYFPSQVSMAGAFTTVGVIRPALLGFLYGFALLLLALAFYGLRMRTARHP